jgi:Asp-tRNA(Asn)/Glu-tRNA(Gln) amidotransferase A subunit family amidase
VQLVGRPFEEARVLTVARLLEQATTPLGRPPI